MKDNNRIFDDYMRNRRPDVNDDRDVSRQTTVVGDLQKRITELEAAAVKWHRYPDEKPTINTHENCSRVLRDFLVVCCGGETAIGNYVIHPDGCFWNRKDVTHYAELPAPPEEK